MEIREMIQMARTFTGDRYDFIRRVGSAAWDHEKYVEGGNHDQCCKAMDDAKCDASDVWATERE